MFIVSKDFHCKGSVRTVELPSFDKAHLSATDTSVEACSEVTISAPPLEATDSSVSNMLERISLSDRSRPLINSGNNYYLTQLDV